MSWRTKTLKIRKIHKGQGISYNQKFIAEKYLIIATTPIGNADGFPRQANNKGYIIVRNQMAKIVGNICMDFIMTDITSLKDIHVLDEVILLGNIQILNITCEDIACWTDTIPYGILCSTGKRTNFVYKLQRT